MTRDEIAQMARKTGFTIHTDDSIYMEMLHSFAALVAAAEREACAKVCDDAISNIWEFHQECVKQVGRNVCTNLATAIRARSKA